MATSNHWRDDIVFIGSSMDRVLKVNVYLNDLKDYKEMNEEFLGDSLVEIDCIARI